MRQLLLGITGVLCLLSAGCNDLEIPTSEVGSMSERTLCILTGGEYRSTSQKQASSEPGKNEPGDMEDENGRCFCGGEQCGERVTCRPSGKDINGNDSYKCGGFAYTLLTSGACTMEGVIVCAERINSDGIAQGYYTKCENGVWTDEASCDGFSCTPYVFQGLTSSKCGECTNDGKTCIRGIKQ